MSAPPNLEDLRRRAARREARRRRVVLGLASGTVAGVMAVALVLAAIPGHKDTAATGGPSTTIPTFSDAPTVTTTVAGDWRVGVQVGPGDRLEGLTRATLPLVAGSACENHDLALIRVTAREGALVDGRPAPQGVTVDHVTEVPDGSRPRAVRATVHLGESTMLWVTIVAGVPDGTTVRTTYQASPHGGRIVDGVREASGGPTQVSATARRGFAVLAAEVAPSAPSTVRVLVGPSANRGADRPADSRKPTSSSFIAMDDPNLSVCDAPTLAAARRADPTLRPSFLVDGGTKEDPDARQTIEDLVKRVVGERDTLPKGSIDLASGVPGIAAREEEVWRRVEGAFAVYRQGLAKALAEMQTRNSIIEFTSPNRAVVSVDLGVESPGRPWLMALRIKGVALRRAGVWRIAAPSLCAAYAGTGAYCLS
ncbi:MAG: hypothetical protein R2698_08650 [Microthrixaceae bacterium]